MVRTNHRRFYRCLSGGPPIRSANSKQAWIEGFIIGVMVGGAAIYGLIQFWGG